MKPLIAFPLEGEESILVEVEELPASEVDGGLVANYPGQQVVVKAQTSFADAMDKIKPVAANIIGKVRELEDSPDEVEEFTDLQPMQYGQGDHQAFVGRGLSYAIDLIPTVSPIVSPVTGTFEDLPTRD